MEVIGVLGFIGSGKGTVADMLVEDYGYRKDSFAASLKDATAQIFNWPRHLLEGDTKESREWREQVDIWWSNELNIPNFTPRFALQYLGTDVLRKGFHDDLWLLTLKNRLETQGGKVVIPDVRFPNEIKLIERLGGKLLWVQRDDLPAWAGFAKAANTGCSESRIVMENNYSHVHSSEWSWVGVSNYTVIKNNGTLDDLHIKVKRCV